MSDVGYWMSDVGCRMSDIGFMMFGSCIRTHCCRNRSRSRSRRHARGRRKSKVSESPCRHMQTYADICRHMQTYADICRQSCTSASVTALYKFTDMLPTACCLLSQLPSFPASQLPSFPASKRQRQVVYSVVVMGLHA
jgi:hypothetical protein